MSIPTSLAPATRWLGRLSLKLSQASPTVLVGVGIIGVGVTAVLASRATLRYAGDQSVRDAIVSIEDAKEAGTNRDVAFAMVDLSVNTARIYGPAIIAGVATVLAIAGGHNIMVKRNAALVTAYSVLDSAYRRYRDAIESEFGADKEREIFERLSRSRHEITVTDQDGNSSQTTVELAESKVSPYARYYDEFAPAWQDRHEANITFLCQMENGINSKLIRNGHVFLNEVYDLLGIPRSEAGQIVGWVYDKERGDAFIDFGIFDKADPQKRLWVNSSNQTTAQGILLDFNVDGPITDILL